MSLRINIYDIRNNNSDVIINNSDIRNINYEALACSIYETTICKSTDIIINISDIIINNYDIRNINYDIRIP